MRVAPGTRLGRYEIETPLGAGGMGEVYRAVDRRLGHAVAYPFLSARDPFLSNLRRDGRFEPLMARVKAIWERL